MSLLFANCGGGTVAPETIEGIWKISAIKLNPGIDVPPLGKVTDLLTAYGLLRTTTCLTDVTFTFKNDGTVTSSNPTSCKDNVAEIKQQTGIDLAGASKWSLTGDQLTVTAADNTKLMATSTIMNGVMTWTYKRTILFNAVSTTQDITFEYKRV
ncbi:MAG: lipocalin family protein [Rudanella sp.]|nr:lipocalin family protein [Rudanella sp.]